MKHSLTLCCLLLAAVSAKAEIITITGDAPVEWSLAINNNFRIFTADSLPDGVGSIPGFVIVEVFGSNAALAEGYMSFAAPMEGETHLFTSQFVREGSVIGSQTQFAAGGGLFLFMFNGGWIGGVQTGVDNYIGFGVKDSQDNTYYGYLQFAFHEYEIGQVAVELLGGAINSVANEAIVITGAIPEPSTWALGAAGAALVLVAARRRVRKAA